MTSIMKSIIGVALFAVLVGQVACESGYVTVRPDANMFWWLMKAGTASDSFKNYPLVLWLQGGPGASSVGFGNFAEIGPLDVHLRPRNNTWLRYANLLFIDNPVGTGFSYVTSEDAYVRNNTQIAIDLVTGLKGILEEVPDFQHIPIYIFAESYGGKMTATFAVHLIKAIRAQEINAHLAGIALGDSWISPIDSTASWSDYLLSLSLIDNKQKEDIDVYVKKINNAVKKGSGEIATKLWTALEELIEEYTGGVDWYNIFSDNSPALQLQAQSRHSYSSFRKSLYRHVRYFHDGLHDSLDDLMNGPIKKKLKIPDEVSWGGQSDEVFKQLEGDFMNDVIQDVEYLLNETDIKVVVYTGQLDLIVDTIGTEVWIDKLQWKGANSFRVNRKELFSGKLGKPKAFVKKEGNFSLYWILQAGHMIPSDQLDVSVEMLQDVIKA